MDNWVTIENLANTVFAPIIIDLLESHDIPARVRADDCGGVDPALTFTHGVEIRVPEQHEETARKLLAEAFPPNDA